MEVREDIWNNLESIVEKNPSLFEKFETDHEIKKLKLQKITALSMRQKILAFQARASSNPDETSKNWIQNEYRSFIWVILVLSEYMNLPPTNFTTNQWDFIGNLFKKPIPNCKYFYNCSRKIKNRTWTSEQDKIISELMQVPKFYKKWTEIGLELFKHSSEQYLRKPKLIRERWSNHLDPNIKKTGWTNGEDLLLIKKIHEIGKKWARIGTMLNGRSEHSVKNRYNHLLNQRCKERKEKFRLLSSKREQQIMQEIYSSLEKRNFSTEHQIMSENQVIKKENQSLQEKSISMEMKNLPNQQDKNMKIFQPEVPTYLFGYFFQPIILTSLQPTQK